MIECIKVYKLYLPLFGGIAALIFRRSEHSRNDIEPININRANFDRYDSSYYTDLLIEKSNVSDKQNISVHNSFANQPQNIDFNESEKYSDFKRYDNLEELNLENKEDIRKNLSYSDTVFIENYNDVEV